MNVPGLLVRRVRRPQPSDPVRGWVVLATLTAALGAVVTTASFAEPPLTPVVLVAALLAGWAACGGGAVRRLRAASVGLRRQEVRALAWAGVNQRTTSRFLARQTAALLIAGAVPAVALAAVLRWATGRLNDVLPLSVVAVAAMVCWSCALLWVIGPRVAPVRHGRGGGQG